MSIYIVLVSATPSKPRIYFAHAPNGSLIVSTPPPTRDAVRIDTTSEVSVPIQKDDTKSLKGSEEFSFEILYVS